jgi:hypothetical protein
VGIADLAVLVAIVYLLWKRRWSEKGKVAAAPEAFRPEFKAELSGRSKPISELPGNNNVVGELEG